MIYRQSGAQRRALENPRRFFVWRTFEGLYLKLWFIILERIFIENSSDSRMARGELWTSSERRQWLSAHCSRRRFLLTSPLDRKLPYDRKADSVSSASSTVCDSSGVLFSIKVFYWNHFYCNRWRTQVTFESRDRSPAVSLVWFYRFNLQNAFD